MCGAGFYQDGVKHGYCLCTGPILVNRTQIDLINFVGAVC